MRRMIVVVLGALLVAGCGTSGVKSDKVAYKSAGSLPPLEVPPDLTTPKEDNRYVVPDASGDKATTLSGYQAGRTQRATSIGDSSVLPSVPNMHVERAGDERWLVVSNEQPEQLWGLVKDFWQQNGFLIKTDMPAAGVMETDWAENRAKLPQDLLRRTLGRLIDQVYSTSERDKFRTRMERTADGKGTEIYISHRGMEEVYANRDPSQSIGATSGTIWQPRPTDPGLEAEFLRRLMVRLGVKEETAKQQVAEAQPGAQRAALKKSADGVEQLEVFEPFDRAWRRVGLALDRVGFTVEDRNRQQGLYFVRYADPETEMAKKDSEKGFFAKLFSSSDKKVKPEQYRVAVKDEKDNSMVQVLDKDGARDKSQTAHRILSLLHEQLK
jgi:outer membrane protein assembly factor BamC